MQLLDKHTELGTPVTNVIGSQHLVSEVLKYSAYTITLNSGSQVTNMHVFGDIWA